MVRDCVPLGREAGIQQISQVFRSWQLEREESWVLLLELCTLHMRGIHSATHRGAQDPAVRKMVVVGSAAEPVPLRCPGASSG